MTKSLVLVGGGHAHLLVLKHLATHRLPDTQLTLISPSPWQDYSGMLPGLMRAQYDRDQCRIDLRPLARQAGARWMEGQVTGIEADQHRVRLHDGTRLDYSWLSLNVGSEVRLQGLQPLGDRLWPIKPLADFAQRWQQLLTSRPQPDGRAFRLAVVGGGAAGVEAALSASAAWRHQPSALDCLLVVGPQGLLPGHARSVRLAVAKALHRQRIQISRLHATADAEGLWLDRSTHWPADMVVAATGAQAPEWLQFSGLTLDARGFVAVNAQHQSVSHPDVFAAGDVCARIDSTMARSGVHAVRAGAVLAHNLCAAIQGEPMRPYRPRRWSLYLLATTPHQAVASWGPFSASGWWVWRLKDHIDRRFMARFSAPPLPS